MGETNGGTKAAWILAAAALGVIGGWMGSYAAQPKDFATKADIVAVEAQISDLKQGTDANTASIDRLDTTVAKIGEHIKLN